MSLIYCNGKLIENNELICQCSHGFDGICGYQMANQEFDKYIFVFGSNLAGIHGKGSALKAKMHYGAISGQGVGLQNNSYAIPTKNKQLKILSLKEIEIYVQEFINFVKQHPTYHFTIVAIGCGLAGYKPNQIAPFFKNCPTNNCNLPNEFIEILNK